MPTKYTPKFCGKDRCSVEFQPGKTTWGQLTPDGHLAWGIDAGRERIWLRAGRNGPPIIVCDEARSLCVCVFDEDMAVSIFSLVPTPPQKFFKTATHPPDDRRARRARWAQRALPTKSGDNLPTLHRVKRPYIWVQGSLVSNNVHIQA